MPVIPDFAIYILDVLGSAGYEAYLVGGCVRDALLGRTPNDWDIASSASPETVCALFERTVPIGMKHGTVTVLTPGGSAEVTAFRAESGYSDHRRPDSVSFTDDLMGDLARRDFTMNAMAMDSRAALRDPFGGRGDIDKKLIRCVGDPARRFGEDALRMLRAFRFSAQLGFEIEEATRRAALENAALCRSLSAERVRDELLKTLASPRPEIIADMINAGMLDGRLERGSVELAGLAAVPPYARLCRLCAALEDARCIRSASGFLLGLRLDSKTVRTTSDAVAVLRSGSRDFKRILRDCGEDTARAAYPDDPELERVLDSDECRSLDTLAVGGDGLAALGLKGREIGRALELALEHVIDHPQDNDAETLCKLIREAREDGRLG